jgi:hypothetical protein
MRDQRHRPRPTGSRERPHRRTHETFGPSEWYLASRREERARLREGWAERGVYENTPSPSAEDPGVSDDDSVLTEEEEELEQELAKLKRKERKEKKRTKDKETAEALFAEDDVLQTYFSEQLSLLREYLDKVEKEVREDEYRRRKEEEENAMVGPERLYSYDDVDDQGDRAAGIAGHYGTHLRPGEGSAMAAYIQQGQRIPRRGEVGLEAEDIDKFERAGYVMSGNRNAKMNAIRMRKENQVYTAEEKAAMALLNFEEKKQKEAKIVADLKKMVEKTMNEAQ